MTKKLIILLAFVFCFTSFVLGQKPETFDVVTFNQPGGWMREVKNGVLTFTKTNTQSGSFTILSIYPSRQSAGNIQTDYRNEWNTIVKEPLKVQAKPETENPVEADGWKIQSGGTVFELEGAKSLALLTVFSDTQRAVSILVLMNSQEFLAEAQKVIESVSLEKTASNSNVASRNTTANSALNGGTNGITKSTTNFADGTVATVQPEYVLITKGEIAVYLYYPIEYKGDIARNSKSYFWKNAVEPLFNVPNPQEFREIGGLVEFLEGSGVERNTGKSVYVGLNIVSKSGWGRAIVGVAPNKQAFQAQFPYPDNLAATEGLNRFAVTENDLIGEWSGGGGSMVELYNIYSGLYAGTAGAAMSDRFTFNGNKSYQSGHKGASGNVGAMNVYSQRHNGTFKVSDWEITLTNRFKGETSVYSAYFEAVRGGRILHLMNKKYNGEKYSLVKLK